MKSSFGLPTLHSTRHAEQRSVPRYDECDKITDIAIGMLSFTEEGLMFTAKAVFVVPTHD
ncbi:Protein of unknown function [Pyronema omphalodes CBS 100304]|uniref:Uncharacterized protein n=1 Tax=Pyronema omphalodes (strain CBS 100304) TaxID=1076935 RepID=U4LIP3_PYROM|nr:Protein of unknown function [Pyronema omphalodes CBS 100304]